MSEWLLLGILFSLTTFFIYWKSLNYIHVDSCMIKVFYKFEKYDINKKPTLGKKPPGTEVSEQNGKIQSKDGLNIA